jgi:RNA polymerase sigma-70 factor (ECF subfamily)
MNAAQFLARMPNLLAVTQDPAGSAVASVAGGAERFRALVDAHYDFIWRSVRRLGVHHAASDDATQQVFWVAWQKLAAIEVGAERSFLFRTAMRVAANHRRSSRVRDRESPDSDAVAQAQGGGATPEELLRWKRARMMLDEALDSMKPDYRCVFVLAELESLTAPEIAAMIGVPVGTVASRLRRAREEFAEFVARLRAREAFRGAP